MRFKQPKPARLDRVGAEAIAATALAFLTADPARLVRFLGDSGMDPAGLAHSLATGAHDMMPAALGHVAADESLLLLFASEARQKPETIMAALALLEGPAPQTSM